MVDIFTNFALFYLFIINIITFVTYAMDKWRAIHSRSRISEFSLLLMAVVGGSIGAWLGMKVWRHKTLHKKFIYGIPSIFILQLLFVVCFICYR